ncbi:MAG: stage III sporulation protein AA [Clostridiales bacterium]|nr:stage III sporulation protein AA [Clostridiales bacterium]
MAKKDEILGLFPDYLREMWQEALQKVESLQEIRLRNEKPVLLSDGRREWFIRKDGRLTEQAEGAFRMGEKELEAVLNHVCQYSLYAYEDEIRQGYLTVPGGHRIGLAGQVVLEGKEKIRTIKHISYMNIRISREVFGAADSLLPFLYERGNFRNVMLISPPGCGKTTVLRDLIRQVSDGNRYGEGRTVGVVDERSELAGAYLGRAQNNLGIRTDVLDACPKSIGMLLLIRSMSPKIIAIDELGEREDMEAVKQAALSGIGLMVTVHGEGIEDIKRRLFLQDILKKRLFKRFVVLHKENGQCRIKDIYDEELKSCLNY